MVPVLVVAFLVVPIVELYVIVQVGHLLGVLPTLGLLLAVSVLGAALVRREGLRTWRALTAALAAGRMPAREVADGGLLLLGGALLLTPGFVTDAVGALLVLPLTRAVARRAVTGWVGRRVLGRRLGRTGAHWGGRAGTVGPDAGGRGAGRAGPVGPGVPGNGVIEGEVVDSPHPEDPRRSP